MRPRCSGFTRRRSLTKAIAAALDFAVLAGSGADGELQGIIGASGVGAFTGASLDLAALLNAQADAGDNLDGQFNSYDTTRAVVTALTFCGGRLLDLV